MPRGFTYTIQVCPYLCQILLSWEEMVQMPQIPIFRQFTIHQLRWSFGTQTCTTARSDTRIVVHNGIYCRFFVWLFSLHINTSYSVKSFNVNVFPTLVFLMEGSTSVRRWIDYIGHILMPFKSAWWFINRFNKQHTVGSHTHAVFTFYAKHPLINLTMWDSYR